MTRLLKHVSLLGVAFLSACSSTSYKVPVSTAKISEQAAKVSTHVAVADNSVKSAATRTDRQIERTTKAAEDAKTLSDHINAAMKLMESKDYIGAAQHLAAAKVGSDVIMQFLNQTLDDLRDTKQNLADAREELKSAKVENEKLKDEVKKVQKENDDAAIQAAKDHAIVEQGEWLFGFGYYIVGTKRLLTHALWGSLILIVVWGLVAIGALWLGGPILARTVLSFPGKIFRWFRKRPTDHSPS